MKIQNKKKGFAYLSRGKIKYAGVKNNFQGRKILE